MPSGRPHPLSSERIVDAASRVVERDSLDELTMRRLGQELGVDPMAIYRHVASKRELLRLVTQRVLESLVPPDPSSPWEARVRQWAISYWCLVTTHRELILAGLADPEIGAGGLAATQPLVDAVGESGIDGVEATAFLVVDAVHGSALAATARGPAADAGRTRRAFEDGLTTILAGIEARVSSTP